MEELNLMRKKINAIDEQLVELFTERMEIVKNIAEIKYKNSMDIFDGAREEQMFTKYTGDLENKELTPFVVEFIAKLLELSKKYQSDVIENIKK